MLFFMGSCELAPLPFRNPSRPNPPKIEFFMNRPGNDLGRINVRFTTLLGLIP